MARPRLTKDIKIQAAIRQCDGIRAELDRLETKQYSSPFGVETLTRFLKQANDSLVDYLDTEEQNPDLDLLDAREQELRIHRTCGLVPYLYAYLGILSGAETGATPSEVVLPLRRFLREILPESEIILRSGAQLNYSIFEIAENIKALLSETPFSAVASNLPRLFYVVTVPPLGTNDALLHATLAHEAGHGLYKQTTLEEEVLPIIGNKIPYADIKKWAQKIASDLEVPKKVESRNRGLPFREVELRNYLTESVTGTVSCWLEELSCDLLAVILLGPSYFFAFVHFISTVALLDEASNSHPPPRLRIRSMCRYLNAQYSFDVCKPIKDFIHECEAESNKPIADATLLVAELALRCFTDDSLLLIAERATAAIPSNLRYSADDFADMSKHLTSLLIDNVPAVEVDKGANTPPLLPGIAQILNAGWYVRLVKFDEFRDNLPEEIRGDVLASERQLHALLLKSLELSEIRRRWSEVKHKLG